MIPNQNLFRLSNERTGFKEAFKMADNVLYMGVRGVTDLMVAPGMVNLDFADIRTVMAEMGKAMMGTGEADGEGRALRAAELAISNPLLEDTSMSGARGLLINITGGEDLTLFEVDQAANRIREEVDEEANIIFGSAIDESLNGRIRVSVVATGIETATSRHVERPHLIAVGGGSVMPMANAVAQHQATAQQNAQATPNVAATTQPRALAPVPAREAPVIRSPAPLGRPMPQPVGTALTRPAPVAQPRAPEARADIRPAELRPAEPVAAHSFEIEEAPLPPRQIPAHLQQPIRPMAAARPVVRTPDPKPVGKPGLFTEAPPPAPRKSLFGIVTGAIRGHAHEAAAEPVRVEPQQASAPREMQPSRPGASEEVGIEIPAFLRRQS